jgi:hypothetical protein
MLGREHFLPSLLAAIVAVMAGVLVGTGIAGRPGAAIETVVDAAARPAAVRPAVATPSDAPVVRREVAVRRHRAARPAGAPTRRPVTAASSPVGADPGPHRPPHRPGTGLQHRVAHGHAHRHTHGHGHAHAHRHGHGHGHGHAKHGRHHHGRE